MAIGSLIQIGSEKHVIIGKFWVGFAPSSENDLQKEYYYETFSMAINCHKRRSAIACNDFTAAMAQGNIKILSAA
jgi:hypothetical protein